MYCPTCGTQLAKSLIYCNKCGATLPTMRGSDDAKPLENTIDSMVFVIVGTTITILGMCLGALVLMKNQKIDFALGTVFVILSFVALVLVEGVLVWRLRNLNKAVKQTGDLAQANDSDAIEQDAVRTRALREPAEPMSSVTEHTTRTFEPSYREDERR
jgi:uncharacterized membrane protein YvbJ